jgi:hypothetical protein
MPPVRGFVVWGVGLFAVLIPFLIFVSVGWPAHPDRCTNIIDHVQVPQTQTVNGMELPDPDHPDSCYCEAFSVEKVDTGAKGIRQPVNTLSNLYAVGSSLVVAFMIYYDRKKARMWTVSRNIFHDPDSWIPDLYIFATLFLGLGSMWFHASLSSTVSWFDGMSMYVFAAFLPAYTIRRRFDIGRGFYWIYFPIVVTCTVLNILAEAFLENSGWVSMLLIGLIVLLYFILELIVLKVRDARRAGGCSAWIRKLADGCRDRWLTPALAFWGAAVGSFILAVFFQVFSQTGAFMCRPDSWFQPHGLLWHTLSGHMAVFLYLYWRKLPDQEANDPFKGRQ